VGSRPGEVVVLAGVVVGAGQGDGASLLSVGLAPGWLILVGAGARWMGWYFTSTAKPLVTAVLPAVLLLTPPKARGTLTEGYWAVVLFIEAPEPLPAEQNDGRITSIALRA